MKGHLKGKGGEKTYSSLVNRVSVVFHTLTVSTSSPTSSSRWVVSARPSSSSEVGPLGPTRSVISTMMEVKPSLSMNTSWLSGTWRRRETSAKCSGRSQTMAPPKRGVDL